MEKSSITRDFPIAKAAYSFLNDKISPSFCFPGWNKGRIICQRLQLKRILTAESAKNNNIVDLSNSSFPPKATIPSSTGNVQRSQYSSEETETNIKTRTELITSMA